MEITASHLVDALTDAAFICDPGGAIVACSDQVLPFFGISDKDKVIGSNLRSFIAYGQIDEAHYQFLSIFNDPALRISRKFQVKKGISETAFAEVTFTRIAPDEGNAGFALVTFRPTTNDDKSLDGLHKKNVRLSKLCDLLLDSTADPEELAEKLLSQIGETLGATACTYSLVNPDGLQPFAHWESPFNQGIKPTLCSRQMLDHLVSNQETHTLIRKPALAAFLASEPTYNEASGVKAILGFMIPNDGKAEAIITAIFTFHYALPTDDHQFIQTISHAIAGLIHQAPAKENEQPARTSSFREMADAIPEPVLVISHEGIIMEVNKSAGRIFGYEREAFIGQTLSMLADEEKNNSNVVQLHFEQAFAGQNRKFEWWGKHKNGDPITTEITLGKASYFGHEVAIAVFSDMSQVKQQMSDLAQQVMELKESNLNKDKFFGIFAHDLKNPFQGLLGFIDLLYEDFEELTSEQVKEYLLNVRNASYHTYNLLENLLEWSRIQSGKMPFTPTVFDIREEISSVISVLENNASQKEITLLNEVEPDIQVLADRNMIHSVIQNLITNSIKFSNSQGRVVVRGRKPQNYDKNISRTNQGEKYWLEISIADNGIGIAEEILPKIFKLNGQYSQPGTANEPGTGLGLVLCHEMVEKNGGRIWAESIPGQGTTFIFTLQLS